MNMLNFLRVLVRGEKVRASFNLDATPSLTMPKVIGHRGCAGLAPENTLSAFAKAIELGVDAIELDVHCTKDNEVVVYHDRKLNPETTRDAHGKWIDDKPLYLQDLTLKDLQHYTVGEIKAETSYAASHPYVEQVRNERIPTLKQVFDLAKKRRAKKLEFLVELKTSPVPEGYPLDPEKLVVLTLEQIRAAKMEKRTHILSFDARSLVFVHSLAPFLRTNYLIEPGFAAPSPWIAWLRFTPFRNAFPRVVHLKGTASWSPCFKDDHLRYITAQQIRKARKKGLKAVVWTPNEPEDLQKMIDLGVDGITTDRPDILLELLKSAPYQRS